MPEILTIRKRPERRIAFTSQRLERYNPPAVGYVMLTDARCGDLKLLVTANGAKGFYVYRKLNGRPVRVPIGPFPTIGIDAARDLARRYVALMVQGIDPRAEKRAGGKPRRSANSRPTTSNCTPSRERNRGKRTRGKSRPTSQCGSRNRSPKSAANTSRLCTPSSARTTATTSPIACWRSCRRCSHSLSVSAAGKAAARPKESGASPKKKRERFLQPDELPAFFKAVDAEPSESIRDFVYVALFTGARRSNVLAMRWVDLNLDAATWTIPAADSKSRKSVLLPLVPNVVKILRSRPVASEFVFPGRHGRGHLKDPMRAWRSICARAGLTDLRIHDLRRTFGSWQAAGGTSLPIIGKSLGHTSTDATAIYSRLHLDPVREAVTAATTAIIAAGKAKKATVRK